MVGVFIFNFILSINFKIKGIEYFGMKFDKEFFISILISLCTGMGVGLVVGLYQFGLPYVVEAGNKVFASREWWVILLNVITFILLSILNFIIIKNARSVDSSGIIAINLSLKRDEDIPHKKEIPLMIANSYISSFAGFPLGSEGPSITLAGKVAAFVNKMFKIKDDDNVKIAFGAGFGAAFISPISGFFYAFEEELHKVDFKNFVRTVVTMLGMSSLIFFLNHHHSLAFQKIIFLPLENSFLLFISFALVIVVAPIFLFIIRRIKVFYIKHDENFIIKYRGFIFFLLMLILGYTIPDFLGGGDKIIQGSLEYKSIYLLLLLLAFRLALTSIIGNGKVTGGLIIPSLSLGALIGTISSLTFENLIGIDGDYRAYIILLTMCMFFAFISEAPLTALTLFFSNLMYSTGSFYIFNRASFLGALLIFSTFLVTKVFKNLPLYDMLVETEEEFKLGEKNC